MSTIPKHVIDKMQSFDALITKLEDSLDKVLEGGVEKHYERCAHDMALVDTMSLFLMDSLLWATHGTQGESADKNHELLVDLARTKRIMGEMKDINLRQDGPRVDKTAVKNFVRNALWEIPKEKEASTSKKEEKTDKK